MLKGIASREVVDSAELSKVGKIVLQAFDSLTEGGAKPPVSYTSALLTATDVFGASKDAVQAYLKAVQTVGVTTDVTTVLEKVRDKQTLVELINEAGSQLQKGKLEVGLISTLLEKEGKYNATLQPVSERIKNGLPDPPQGLNLKSLSVLTKATGGLYGMWVIGGEPGLGKSTLAWQIALDVGRGVPVLYYDIENGFSVLMDRTRSLFGGDLNKIREATTKLYVRDSIRSLESDLATVAPPAMVVVDSVQKLTASVQYVRSSLDRWIHRLEMLKKRGYHILLVSEVGRAMYHSEANIAAFKETGEIEYAADAGMVMLPGTGDLTELHVVKNRHRPFRGFLEHLSRVRGGWWFRESAGQLEEAEPLRELD